MLLSGGKIKSINCLRVVIEIESRISPFITFTRHGIDTNEFIIVIRIQVPCVVRIWSIEVGIPFLCDGSSVFRSHACTARNRIGIPTIIRIRIMRSGPTQRIHITCILDDDDRRTVCLDLLRRGFLEREILFIKITRSILISLRFGQRQIGIRRSLSRNIFQEGITVIICIFDHVDDLVIYLSRVPLGIEGRIVLQYDRGPRRLRAGGILVPAGKGVAGAGGRGGQGDGGAVGSRHRVDIVAAVHIVGEGEVPAGIVDLQLLVGVAGDGHVSSR